MNKVFFYISLSFILLVTSVKSIELKLEQLGYSCEKLESQKIEVDTLFN